MGTDLTPLGNAGALLAGAKVLAPFLEKILGQAATELGGVIADPIAEYRKGLSERRTARRNRMFGDAAEQINRIGLEPVRIPDYLLVPMLDRGTLVEDESLLEKWASLLATAANPNTAASMSHLFPVMLSNLSPREAKFLDVIFDYSLGRISVKISPIAPSTIAGHSRMSDGQLLGAVTTSSFKWQSNEEKTATLDNLVSLGILRRDTEIAEPSYKALANRLLNSVGMNPKGLPVNVVVQTEDFHQLTVAGAAFVIACRPLDQRP